jgi:hypothetical protein
VGISAAECREGYVRIVADITAAVASELTCDETMIKVKLQSSSSIDAIIEILDVIAGAEVMNQDDQFQKHALRNITTSMEESLSMATGETVKVDHITLGRYVSDTFSAYEDKQIQFVITPDGELQIVQEETKRGLSHFDFLMEGASPLTDLSDLALCAELAMKSRFLQCACIGVSLVLNGLFQCRMMLRRNKTALRKAKVSHLILASLGQASVLEAVHSWRAQEPSENIAAYKMVETFIKGPLPFFVAAYTLFNEVLKAQRRAFGGCSSKTVSDDITKSTISTISDFIHYDICSEADVSLILLLLQNAMTMSMMAKNLSDNVIATNPAVKVHKMRLSAYFLASVASKVLTLAWMFTLLGWQGFLTSFVVTFSITAGMLILHHPHILTHMRDKNYVNALSASVALAPAFMVTNMIQGRRAGWDASTFNMKYNVTRACITIFNIFVVVGCMYVFQIDFMWSVQCEECGWANPGVWMGASWLITTLGTFAGHHCIPSPKKVPLELKVRDSRSSQSYTLLHQSG